MTFRDLVLKTRTVRKFDQSAKTEMATLRELVDLARLAASGANMQPLKYVLSCDPEKNARIRPLVIVGGEPKEGQYPAAYIIVLGDKTIRESFGCDHGIAVQNIMLGATEKGLAGVIVGNVRREELAKALTIPARYEVLLVLALGKPAEKVVLEKIPADGNLRGWWDDKGIRHTPKRSLDEIILMSF
jgi:nitroreductase